MIMEEALTARLAGAAGVAAICGDRISFFGRQRDDALPALVLTTVSPGRAWTLTHPDNLDRAMVQFDCWGTSPAQVLALKMALRTELEAEATVGGIKFHPAMLAALRTDEETDPDGGPRLFQISLDYLFYHEET